MDTDELRIIYGKSVSFPCTNVDEAFTDEYVLWLENKLMKFIDFKNMKKTEKQFSIDFFELLFLSESVIPPRPIARSMCFDDFSEIHYHKMTESQRSQFFAHVSECSNFSLENEQCKHFHARFNPKNQYLIHYSYDGKSDSVNCYYYDNEYRTSMNRYVKKDFITKVTRIHNNEMIQ